MHEPSDRELLDTMISDSRNERRGHAVWLQRLALIDDRRLYNLEGYESLWEYVHKHLNYSEGTVGKRIQVMRTGRKFPLIFSLIGDSELSMAAVSRLTPHLTAENHAELLHKAKRKSVRWVEEMVAGLSPKPDVPDKLRAVRGTAGNEQAALDLTPMPEKPKPRETSSPLSAKRFHASFTIDKEANDKYARLKSLTRHLPHPPSMEDIYRAGLEAYLKKHDPDISLKKARAAKPPKKHTRYVTQEIRRLVRPRDGSRCTFVSPDGRRCEATTNLQYDHVIPWALGGSSRDPANIRLLCGSHNRWMAMKTFPGNVLMTLRLRGRNGSFLVLESNALADRP